MRLKNERLCPKIEGRMVKTRPKRKIGFDSPQYIATANCDQRDPVWTPLGKKTTRIIKPNPSHSHPILMNFFLNTFSAF